MPIRGQVANPPLAADDRYLCLVPDFGRSCRPNILGSKPMERSVQDIRAKNSRPRTPPLALTRRPDPLSVSCALAAGQTPGTAGPTDALQTAQPVQDACHVIDFPASRCGRGRTMPKTPLAAPREHDIQFPSSMLPDEWVTSPGDATGAVTWDSLEVASRSSGELSHRQRPEGPPLMRWSGAGQWVARRTAVRSASMRGV